MALGYLAVAIPRVALHFLLREWYRTVANHWRALLKQRANRARQALSEATGPEERADFAIASYLADRRAEAAEILRKDLKSAPRNPRLLNPIAAIRAVNSQWSEAAEALAAALKTAPDDQVSQHNLAMLLAEIPPEVPLPDHLYECIERAGKSVLNNLATRQMRAGDLDEAEATLRQALADAPLYPYAQANIGVLAFREYDTEKASVNLAAAAQFAPTSADILAAFGAVLAMQGNRGEAQQVFRRARRIDARHAATLINYGALLIEQEKHADALEVLQDIAADDEMEALAWHNSAVANAALGELGQAHDYAEMALRERPENPAILSCIGVVEWRMGDYESADARFRKAINLAPNDVNVTINAARAAIGAGDGERAADILESLEDRREHDPNIIFDHGVTNLMLALRRRKADMNRTEQDLFTSALGRAAEAFEKTLEHKNAPEYEARFNLGLTAYLQSDMEVAAREFARAARLRPDDAAVHYCAGTAWAHAADFVQEERAEESKQLIPEARRFYARARKHLEKATASSRAAAHAFNNLGLVCYEMGQIDEAMKAFRRLVQIEDSVDANNSLALAYARQGQEAYNSSLVERVRARMAGEQSMLTESKKLLSSAIHYFSEALRYEPRNPVLHSNIGLAYMLRNRRDDVEHALHHWKRMREAGGQWAERQFQRMVQVMNVDDKNQKAQFHDVGRSLRPIPVSGYLRKLPPVMGRPMYIVEPVPDTDHWQFETDHDDLRVALRARERLLAMNDRLKRLAI
ncbi:MAG: tetratricopeptide repeat protein [Armatimonadota bacterium]